jgi:hypothetical protein
MKTLDRQKLDITNQTRSNTPLRYWRGQFTPECAERDLHDAVILR